MLFFWASVTPTGVETLSATGRHVHSCSSVSCRWSHRVETCYRGPLGHWQWGNLNGSSVYPWANQKKNGIPWKSRDFSDEYEYSHGSSGHHGSISHIFCWVKMFHFFGCFTPCFLTMIPFPMFSPSRELETIQKITADAWPVSHQSSSRGHALTCIPIGPMPSGWWFQPTPSEKWWTSSVGMIIPFPTEWWKNMKKYVPNHQPAISWDGQCRTWPTHKPSPGFNDLNGCPSSCRISSSAKSWKADSHCEASLQAFMPQMASDAIFWGATLMWNNIRVQLVGGFYLPAPKNDGVRQLGLLFPIYGNIKHVPSHQPDNIECGSWTVQLSLILLHDWKTLKPNLASKDVLHTVSNDWSQKCAEHIFCSTKSYQSEGWQRHMGLSENSVPLNPMVNDHYTY